VGHLIAQFHVPNAAAIDGVFAIYHQALDYSIEHFPLGRLSQSVLREINGSGQMAATTGKDWNERWRKVMANILFDPDLSDYERRSRLYAGDILVYSPSPETASLIKLARDLLEAVFAPRDPRIVHETTTPEQLAAALAKLKPEFVHHQVCKQLIAAILRRMGCDPDQVYFDVPRLRSAYPKGHLNSGIAYAFHVHRDTWYSAPMCQINWWLPVYPLARENCLAFYPQYFDRPITNSSEMHNHYKWNAEGRTTAAQHVRDDARQQPKPQEAVQGPDIRLIPPPGSLILFSGAQLHATVENTSGVARYSVDFRTVHLGDAAQRNGALNVDSRCTGTTLRDYLRGSDLTHIPDDVVRLYDDGTETAQDAVLYFTGVSSPTHFEGR
jgi:hypothetical protein